MDTINENFIGKYIEDTYQKVLHIANDNTLANGTGSFVSTLRVGNLIFSGSDSIYLSFGNTEDSSGYGFRDINGILQFKNKSGSGLPIDSQIALFINKSGSGDTVISDVTSKSGSGEIQTDVSDIRSKTSSGDDTQIYVTINSSSFTNYEDLTNVPNNIISSSNQIATNISGSGTPISISLASHELNISNPHSIGGSDISAGHTNNIHSTFSVATSSYALTASYGNGIATSASYIKATNIDGNIDSSIYFSGGNVGIGNTSPSSQLHVGADNLGMTVDVTSGIRLNSNTPATSDLNQISPLLTFRSNNGRSAWAPFESIPVDFSIYSRPYNASTGQSDLVFAVSNNEGAFTELFNLDGFNGIFTLMKSTGGFSFVNDNVRIVRTSNVMQLFSWVGHYFYNAADVASGNMINFVTGTNAELTDTNAEQSFFYIEPKIKQTLTGAYNGLKINVIERGVGDGSTGDGNNLLNVALDGVSKFVINNSGSVGIGTTSPANPLAVNRHEDGIIVDFESEDTIEGNISIADATTSYNAFVGSHYTQLKHRQHELPIGSVVISTGEIIPCNISCQKFTRVPINEATTIIPKANAIEIKEIEVEDKDNIISTDITYTYDPETDTETSSSIYTYGTKIVQKKQLKRGIIFNGKSRNFYTINSGYVKRDNKFYIEETIIRHKPNKEYFVYVDTTNIESDNRVYGVGLGKMSDDAKGMSFGNDSNPVYLIAQVGLFKIRVTDTNGNIANGDYLETSERIMEAQKQTSESKLNSTIAKSLVDVDGSLVDIDIKLGYKWKLIPCIF